MVGMAALTRAVSGRSSSRQGGGDVRITIVGLRAGRCGIVREAGTWYGGLPSFEQLAEEAGADRWGGMEGLGLEGY